MLPVKTQNGEITEAELQSPSSQVELGKEKMERKITGHLQKERLRFEMDCLVLDVA